LATPEEAVEHKARMSEEADETELVKKNFLTLFSPQILVPVISIETNRFLCSYELRQVRVSKKCDEFAVVRPQ